MEILYKISKEATKLKVFYVAEEQKVCHLAICFVFCSQIFSMVPKNIKFSIFEAKDALVPK